MNAHNAHNTVYDKKGQLELLPIPYNKAEELLLKSGIKFYTSHCWRIPEPIVDKFFASYYLLYWSGYHVLQEICAGTITHKNVAYRVKFKDHLTRGYILKHQSDQYAISFRESNIEWEVDPVVIISAVSAERNL